MRAYVSRILAPMSSRGNGQKPQKNLWTELTLAAVLLALGVVARLIDHTPNFTPLAAVGLFAGAVFGRRWLAIAVPLAAMVLGDLFIGFYETGVLIAVYGCIALSALMGIAARRYATLLPLVPLALVSSLLFFTVTNFAVWYCGTMYHNDLSGLLASYIAGLPFLQFTFEGDLTWTVTLVSGYYAFRALLSRTVDLVRFPAAYPA